MKRARKISLKKRQNLEPKVKPWSDNKTWKTKRSRILKFSFEIPTWKNKILKQLQVKSRNTWYARNGPAL